MDDELVMAGLKEAWLAGYQTAVNSLREMADEYVDEQIKLAIRNVANMLEEMKPCL